MITIVEGPDCSGKTSLINNIFGPKSGWVVEHTGPPSHSGAWFDYSKTIGDLWYTRHVQNVVFDRFVYGELVYGPLLRRQWQSPKAFTPAHARMLERVLLSMQAVLVCAQTDYETTEQLFKERQDQELLKSTKLLKESWSAFHLLFTNNIMPSLPKVKYDFQTFSPSDIKAAIESCRPLENKGPGIGHWNPGKSILMVGEQPNAKTTTHGWPFVAGGESSLWLAQELDKAKVREDQLYWVNALDAQGIETSPIFLNHLEPRTVIALGKAAEIWCKKHLPGRGAQLFAIPHPQFWKRFKSPTDMYPLHQIFPGYTICDVKDHLELGEDDGN